MKKIIFLGDSLTDARRTDGLNSPYGTGFVSVIQNTLSFRYFGRDDVEIINKGVGGETLLQISARIDNDVLAFRPDAVFFIAGVNDSWRKFDTPGGGTSDADFERTYRESVIKILSSLPSRRLVLGIPYALPVNEISCKIMEDLPSKIAIVKQIAKDYRLPILDLDEAFHKLSEAVPPAELALDGVHPAPIGCGVIASLALKLIEGWYFS